MDSKPEEKEATISITAGREKMIDQLVLVECLMLYWYNIDPMTIMKQLFVDVHLSYLQQKVDAYQDGLQAFWGRLDWEHRDRLLEAAISRYSDQARQRVGAWANRP